MTYDVFISYSTKDKIVADAIVAALEGQGYRCWYAPRDITLGAGWGEAITDAIGECKIFVMVFSKNSNQSKRVLEEVFFAITEGKTVIPFRIENLDPTGAMRLHLSMLHWLDAYQPSWQAHIERLIKSISAELGQRKAPLGVLEAPTASDISFPVKKRIKTPWLWIGLALVLTVLLSASGIWWLGNRPKSIEPQPTSLAQVKTTDVVTQSPTQARSPTPAQTSRPPATATRTPSPSVTANHTSSPSVTATALPSWATEFGNPIRMTLELEEHPPNQYTLFELQEEGENFPLPTWLNFGCGGQPEVIKGELIWDTCSIDWIMWYTDFVIEMDVRHLVTTDRWDFYFRNIGYRFEPNYIAILDGKGIASEEVNISLEKPFRAAIIVKGFETALYIDDQPLLYSKLPLGWKSGEGRWFAGGNDPVAAFSRIYVWDLNNLK